MTLINVSFGIYAFLPQGWIFMLVIILIECLGLSYFLTKKWYDLKVYQTAIFSNLISGAFGIILSMFLNGGWWLVVWFPWVGKGEVHGANSYNSFLFYYALAFVLTLLIEGIYNSLMLGKKYTFRQKSKATLLVNIVSYLLGSIAMYSYSF